MKLLLFAPKSPDLPYFEVEIQDLFALGIQIIPMLGEIRKQDFSRTLRLVKPGDYQVLYLMTHGTQDGIYLSDGLFINALLTPLTKGKFPLIVLNTCSSIVTAQTLQNETEAEVICTIKEVSDYEAAQTGVLFIEQLIKTGDPGLAYNAARSASNESYIRLAGSKKDIGVRFSMNEDQWNISSRRELNDLTKLVYQLSAQGDQRSHMITEIHDELTRQSTELKQMRESNRANYREIQDQLKNFISVSQAKVLIILLVMNMALILLLIIRLLSGPI